MRRKVLFVVFIFTLVLDWSMVLAEDGFYVISTKKKNYAPVPKTGQITSYASGDDGDMELGVGSPNPRFTDNGNGTVKDNLTGLIWLKNANCASFFSGDSTGQNHRSWSNAVIAANSLESSYCGLTDDSFAGDWRLPNARELKSLIDYGNYNPALPSGHPFTGVQSNFYWSSTTSAPFTNLAWWVNILYGDVNGDSKTSGYYVWPVRGGN